MPDLWCHHALFPGRWQSGNGFDRVLPRAFRNITDLAAMIADAVPAHSIRRLGLIVHGEEGELRTGATGDNLVTPHRIRHDMALRRALGRIEEHLQPHATVEFYSCSAAASRRGSDLLSALSQLWPGRTIVGAISKGYRFATLTAGDVKDTLLTVIRQVRSTDQFYVPGETLASGRSQFHLPPGLPRFLSVPATVKKARDGAIVQMAQGPAAFQAFQAHYPPSTRSMILDSPLLMVVGSERTFYATYLINMDWPPEHGKQALLAARGLRNL